MIRVFLIDELSALTALKNILGQSLDITVVGTAHNRQQALAQVPQLKPDVVCSEAYLPGEEGVALAEQLMDVSPVPILMLSAALQDDPSLAASLLAAGVVGVLARPAQLSGFEDPQFARELIRKIKLLSGVSVFRRKQRASSVMPTSAISTSAIRPSRRILVIGASTGGPQALEVVLSKLPAHYPFPIICVQHISQGFLDPFLLWLGGKVKLSVGIAQVGEKPMPGRIYFAPDHANLEFDGQGRFTYSHAIECLHYPSVDKTFQAIAEHYASSALAVLLTGMGDDGALGLQAIANAGGVTIAQDEASCVVFGMPKAAIASGAVQKVLNLEQIAEELCRHG